MKKLLCLVGLTLSALSFAQSGRIEVGGVSVRIEGRGQWVCSAQAMSSDRPVLARGESQREAEVLAKQECTKQGNGFFCKVQECERDVVNNNSVDVVFDITRNGANIGINYKGNVKFLCTVEAWSNVYMAKAPTKVEAKVLASNACADGNDNSAFFCDVKDRDCSQISGTTGSGGIRIPDIFRR